MEPFVSGDGLKVRSLGEPAHEVQRSVVALLPDFQVYRHLDTIISIKSIFLANISGPQDPTSLAWTLGQHPAIQARLLRTWRSLARCLLMRDMHAA